LKQLIRRGITILKEKRNQYCSYKKDAEPNRFAIFLKKFYIKFTETWKEICYLGKRNKKGTYQSIGLKLLLAD
jgi:hypothetical protein